PPSRTSYAAENSWGDIRKARYLKSTRALGPSHQDTAQANGRASRTAVGSQLSSNPRIVLAARRLNMRPPEVAAVPACSDFSSVRSLPAWPEARGIAWRIML